MQESILSHLQSHPISVVRKISPHLAYFLFILYSPAQMLGNGMPAMQSSLTLQRCRRNRKVRRTMELKYRWGDMQHRIKRRRWGRGVQRYRVTECVESLKSLRGSGGRRRDGRRGWVVQQGLGKRLVNQWKVDNSLSASPQFHIMRAQWMKIGD